MRSIPILFAAVALSGCTMAPEPGRSADAEATLDRMLAGRVAGPAVTCLPYGRDEMTTVDQNTILFKSGRTVYRNDLRSGGCSNLGGGYALVTRSGSGRLFEGTPQQMFDSLQRLVDQPDDTLLYCAHEYTLSNARFAAHADPGNEAIGERLKSVEQLRESGAITLPTSVAEERATNVFVRASDWQEFARLRAEKDSFR